MHEKPYRSIMKAISWRMLGTFDTILISFLISGKIKVAISIGIVELITKTILYYCHERVWNRISIGRIKVKEADFSI